MLSNKKFWELYEGIPEELKDMISSEKSTENIYNTCKEFKCLDRFDEVNEYTGHVLLGILPPNEFQETLTREGDIEKIIARKIAQRINRLVFFPVKRSLSSLYDTEMTFSETGTPKPTKKQTFVTPKKDLYRELVE